MLYENIPMLPSQTDDLIPPQYRDQDGDLHLSHKQVITRFAQFT